MIFGKIDPVASVIQQTTPFQTTTITGSYMTAIARPYMLGANEVNFQVIYGNATLDENGKVTSFQQVFSDNTLLTGSAIATWGEDDSVILEAIAAQQGTTVVEIVTGDNRVF